MIERIARSTDKAVDSLWRRNRTVTSRARDTCVQNIHRKQWPAPVLVYEASDVMCWQSFQSLTHCMPPNIISYHIACRVSQTDRMLVSILAAWLAFTWLVCPCPCVWQLTSLAASRQLRTLLSMAPYSLPGPLFHLYTEQMWQHCHILQPSVTSPFPPICRGTAHSYHH